MSRTERKQKVQSDKKKSRKARFENSIKEESGVTSGEKKVKGKKFQRFKNWFSGLKTWKKVLFVAGIVILVLALTVGAIAYSYFNDIFGEIHEPTPEDYDLSLVDVDGYYNILLLGVDSRDMDKLKGTRSDAIMIVSINKDTNDVKITSVYRDTYLKMGDTSTYDKITHACAYGGPEMSMKSLNQAMDLNISNYVVVNFKAVADLVDAVGGIEVDVQQYEIQQLNKYTKETANNIGRKKYKLVESPGVQTLEGVQAVSYGRIRKGVGDDFKRTERMRTVMSLVMDKMKEMPFKEIKKLIKIMTPQVQTNLTKGNILGLAFRLPQYNISTGDGWPYKVTTGSINGGSYVFPSNLANNVKELHAKLFARMDYSPSSMVVTISNAIISRLEAERAAGTITNEKTPVVDTPDTNTGTGGTGDGTGGTGGTGGDAGGGTGDGTGDGTGGTGDGSGGDAGTGDGSGGDAGSGGGTGDGN